MFEPHSAEITRKNLYESVAVKIEEMMVEGTLSPGTRLPSEQAMADYFGVSRNVIREAFKALRERGLIEVNNGEGALVKAPDPSLLIPLLQRMLTFSPVNLADLYELRSALEVRACKLFARCASLEKIEKLQKIVDSMEGSKNNQTNWVQLDLDFHRLLVKSTGNQVLYNFYKPILSAMRYIFTASWPVEGAAAKGVQAHRALIAALVKKDENAAAACMEQHLSESLEDIRQAGYVK